MILAGQLAPSWPTSAPTVAGREFGCLAPMLLTSRFSLVPKVLCVTAGDVRSEDGGLLVPLSRSKRVRKLLIEPRFAA